MRAERAHLFQVGTARVASDIELPAYARLAGGSADWTVRVSNGRRPRAPAAPDHCWRTGPDNHAWLSFTAVGDDSLLRFRRVGDVVISEKRREICVYPLAPRIGAAVMIAVQNHALPLALGLRDWVVHASAVADASATVVFAGASGSGKSTLASYLALQGWGLLADDAVSLHEPWEAPVPVAIGGSIRLRRDSLQQVFKQPLRAVPRLVPGSDKHVMTLQESGVRVAVANPTVRLLYLLDDGRAGEAAVSEPATPIDATLRLLRCTFVMRVHDPDVMRATFSRITGLVAGIAVRKLRLPACYEGLSGVPRIIARDLRG